MKEVIGGIMGAVLGAKRVDPDAKKWKLAIDEAFPDADKTGIIVMTPDSVKKEQEKLRRAIEEKRKEEAQGEATAKRATATRYRRDGLPKELQEQLASGKIPPMPGDNLPISEWMRIRQGLPTTEEARPKREAKPKVPNKTTEEAQRDLTETGRRKIIMGEEK